MRILISNPDTIGDVVLRQPLLARLARDGHEVALVAPPLVAPLIDLIAPEARVIRCELNAYAAGLEPADARLDPVVEAARDFDPEVVVAAPWQLTPVESRLLNEFPQTRRVGFAGRRFFDPVRAAPPDWPLPLDQAIEAPIETPEVRKNQLLAGAILGRSVRLGDPRLTPTEEHKSLAAAALEKAGLAPGAYLVACVGHTDWTRIRNWRPQNWGAALAHWRTAHGRDILLVGSEAERDSAREVARHMGDAGAGCAEWFGAGQGDLPTLVGLIALSRGYVGRDTGPMHLAAALKQPVLAVFGGGTWPRFTPAVDPSVTLTVSVPCVGCEWRCDLEDSHCIKEVPLAEVIRAIDELESGAITKRTLRALPPPPAVAARIGVELTRAARERLVQISIERFGDDAGDSEVTATLTKELDDSRTGQEQERRRRAESEAELKVLREQRGQEAERIERLEDRLEHRTNELLEARERRAELKGQLDMERQESARLRQQLEARAEQLARAQAEVQQSEALRRELAAERARAEDLAAAESKLAKEVKRLTARIDELRRQADGAALPAEAHDLQVKLGRAVSDRDAAMKLSRQREHEMMVLQSRLDDLLASRWRKLGQKIGVAMTLPWEENLNGPRNGAG